LPAAHQRKPASGAHLENPGASFERPQGEKVKLPRFLIDLLERHYGLDPYRCYLTDERPKIVGPSKVIRVTMTVDIEVPHRFITKDANMGIARSVVMENFKTEETARIQTWHIVKAEDLTGVQPSRRGCKVCGKPWDMKDVQCV
jgi:hypothetical protein